MVVRNVDGWYFDKIAVYSSLFSEMLYMYIFVRLWQTYCWISNFISSEGIESVWIIQDSKLLDEKKYLY